MGSLYKQNELRAMSTSALLSYFLMNYDDGELYFNPLYQRDYVWSSDDAQLLLDQIFDNQPLGALAVVLNKNGDNSKFCEIVDGRQRLTTLIRFVKGEYPYVDEHGAKIYFCDMTKYDQLAFKKTKVPYYELSNDNDGAVTDKQKVDFFYRVNFAGVPQSESHKKHLETLLEQL